MCGLVGCLGEVLFAQEKVFKDLLRVDVVRGTHSTGILGMSTNLEYTIAKGTELPDDLFETRFGRVIFAQRNRLLLGHNRQASVGAVTKANAHPFEAEHIIGAHNGTLQSKYKLDNSKCDTDSEALFSDISDHGFDDTFPKLSGSYALTWFDINTCTVHFFRNEERPLYFCLSDDNKVLYWASESWMLTACILRNSAKMQKIEPFDPFTLYSVKVGRTVEKIEIVKKGYEKPKENFIYRVVNTATRSVIGENTGGTGNKSIVGNERPYASLGNFRTLERVIIRPFQHGTDLFGKPFLLCRVDGKPDVRYYYKENPNSRKWDSKTQTKRLALKVRDYFFQVGNDKEGKYWKCCADVVGIEWNAIPYTPLVVVQEKKIDELNSVTYLHDVYPDKIPEHKIDHDGTPLDDNVDDLIGDKQQEDIPFELKVGDAAIEEEELGEDEETRECFNKEILNKKEFDKRYTSCAVCGEQLFWDDDLIKFIDHQTGICGDCRTSPQTQKLFPEGFLSETARYIKGDCL